MELEERAVELIGLGDDSLRIGIGPVVGIVIDGNAAEEGGASDIGMAKDMGGKRRRGSLAVGTGDAIGLERLRQLAEGDGPLDDSETAIAEKGPDGTIGGDGGGKDDERLTGVAERHGDCLGVVRIGDCHPFGLKRTGDVGGSTIVSRHMGVEEIEVASDGTHTDATNPDEIDVFAVLVIHNRQVGGVIYDWRGQ